MHDAPASTPDYNNPPFFYRTRGEVAIPDTPPGVKWRPTIGGGSFPPDTPAPQPRPAHYHRHPDDSYSPCDCAASPVERAAGEWIPVEEGLPDDGVEVLVWLGGLGMGNDFGTKRIAWRDHDTDPPQWVSNGDAIEHITHWQPLAAAPERKD